MFLYTLVGFLLGVTLSLAAVLVAVYSLFMRVGVQQAQKSVQPIEIKHSIVYQPPPPTNTPIETCTWLNTAVTRLCTEALSSPLLRDQCYKQLYALLNNPVGRPDFLGEVQIADLNFGSGLPQVEGIKLLSSSLDKMVAEIDIGYHGGASFGIETELWLNWPHKKFACLPISLHATLDNFYGKLIIECPPPGMPGHPFVVSFQALPNYNLRLGSTIGHSSKLVNVEKISDVIQTIIRDTINNELVSPNGVSFTVDNGVISNVEQIRVKQSQPLLKQTMELGNSTEFMPEFDTKPHQQPSFLSSLSSSISSPVLGTFRATKNPQPTTTTIMPPTTMQTYSSLFSKSGQFLDGDLRNRNFSVFSDT